MAFGRTRLTLDRAPARRRHGVSRLVFAVRSPLAFTFSHGGNEKKPSSSALPPPPPSPPPCLLNNVLFNLIRV
ncbi:hypothetical protein V1478_011335 [Vespula squamosa]|uniref:Uncharacterized protein n=1 Tax=Vespula squamosa TaxID=30214 RepID=A0ABD2AE66_VESSQ